MVNLLVEHIFLLRGKERGTAFVFVHDACAHVVLWQALLSAFGRPLGQEPFPAANAEQHVWIELA